MTSDTPPSPAGRFRVPWVVIAPVVVGGLALAAWLAVGGVDNDPFIVAMLWLSPLFAFLAATIATRVPGNSIAWLLLTVGLSVPVASLVSVTVPVEAPAEGSILLGVALLVVEASWMAFVFPILLVLFLFPTGSFLTPRWRWAGWLVGAMVAIFSFLGLFSSELGSSTYGWVVVNPVGFLPPTILEGAFVPIWSAGLVVLAIGGLISIVLRYRRSVLVARTQIKWFVVPAVAFAAFYALSAAVPGETWTGTRLFSFGFALAFLSLPVAMTIAITRYRLYEIDRIVSRTVLYALVLVVMAAVYTLALLVLGLVVPIEGDAQVAIATLAAVGVSAPVVGRLRRWVDKRFFRSRYDAAAIVAAFASDLSHTIDGAEVVARAKAVVEEVFAPEAVGVWLEGSPT